MKHLENDLSLFPEGALGWAVRGMTKFLLGDKEGAKEDALRSLSVAPNVPAYRLLYLLAMKEACFLEAVERARHLASLFAPLSQDPEVKGQYVDSLLGLAKALKEAGDLGEALKTCEDAERQEVSSRVLGMKGEILEAMGRWEEAKEAFQAALRQDPENGSLHFALMRVLVSLGGEENLKEALCHGWRAQGSLSRLPKGFFETMAKAYEELGLTEKAKEARQMEQTLFPERG